MLYSLSLIDKAAEVCGSYYKLSKSIGLAESTISEIRKGTRRVPLDCVPILADLCRIDVHEALDRVMLEYAKGTKREHQLNEILGKVLAGGAVALWLFSYSGSLIGSSAGAPTTTAKVDLLYIVLSRARGWLTGIKRLLVGPREPRGAWGVVPPPPRP